MRVVLDTNVLISGLLRPNSGSGRLLAHWRARRFVLISCEEQFAEMRRVSRLGKISDLIPASAAGTLVNALRKYAELFVHLPKIDRSPDPFDNYLLALAEVGKAQFLVTGDKQDLLSLGGHGPTRIETIRQFLERIEA